MVGIREGDCMLPKGSGNAEVEELITRRNQNAQQVTSLSELNKSRSLRILNGGVVFIFPPVDTVRDRAQKGELSLAEVSRDGHFVRNQSGGLGNKRLEINVIGMESRHFMKCFHACINCPKTLINLIYPALRASSSRYFQSPIGSRK